MNINSTTEDKFQHIKTQWDSDNGAGEDSTFFTELYWGKATRQDWFELLDNQFPEGNVVRQEEMEELTEKLRNYYKPKFEEWLNTLQIVVCECGKEWYIDEEDEVVRGKECQRCA